MPRGSNFYYAGDQAQLGAGLGQTLGRALFGDPEAATQLALRKAQADTYAAQAGESRSHGSLYDAQAADQTTRTAFRQKFGPLGDTILATMAPPAAPAAPAAPTAPADPLAVLPGAPPHPDQGALARALIPMIMAAGGTQENPNIGDMVGGVTALLGNDETARRGLVAQGVTPGKDFALTTGRADDIAQQGYAADYRKGTDEARINHASDIPVARINHESDIPVANIQAGARRDVASLGKTIGFSLVSDVLPGARMTSGERDPAHNAEVGGAPGSYHLPGDGVEAFDIEPGTGARTYADAAAAMRAKYGSRLVEAIDETHTPGHGPHWHFAIADVPISKGAKTTATKQISAASEKMVSTELDSQLKAAGLNAQGQARSNMLASALRNYQSTGNPTLAVKYVLNELHNRTAARDAPPVQGAQKAPDGHWYVKRGGQFYRVDAS